MNVEELYNTANKFYRTEGAELDAIKHYKILLESYPNYIEGWCDLAAMEYSICDFDQAIKSSKKALQLDPENAWNTNNFLTKLNECVTKSLRVRYVRAQPKTNT